MNDTSLSARDHSQNQWNRVACGEVAGSREDLDYFLRVEAARYREQSWQHDYFQFERFRGQKVLEIGVGQGSDLVQFAKSGALCHGVDITDNHLELTRKNFALRGYDAVIRRCDATALDFPDQSFDCVYSFGVMHHIPEISLALSEAWRVLAPGGMLMVAVYHKWSVFTLFRKLLGDGLRHGRLFRLGYRGLLSTIETGADGIEIAPYVQLYTTWGFRRLVTQAGFAVRDISVHQLAASHFYPKEVGHVLTSILPHLEGYLGWYVACKAIKPMA